ncbi:MAG: DUF177 domain-containing protein [Coriobacteriia bacterium]|nr:DUF177 domain-containing protein [Coriobacteriia bacterium]
MEPLQIDVGELLTEHGASVAVQRTVAVGTLMMGESAFVPADAATIDVLVSHAGEGVVASGTVDADFRVDCSRCLAPFTLHVRGDVQGLYVQSLDETWEEEEDAEPITAGKVDLSRAVESALRVELPLAPLHDDECKGICPSCGADLNAAECGCHETVASASPFDVLRTLMIDDDSGQQEPED